MSLVVPHTPGQYQGDGETSNNIELCMLTGTSPAAEWGTAVWPRPSKVREQCWLQPPSLAAARHLCMWQPCWHAVFVSYLFGAVCILMLLAIQQCYGLCCVPRLQVHLLPEALIHVCVSN